MLSGLYLLVRKLWHAARKRRFATRGPVSKTFSEPGLGLGDRSELRPRREHQIVLSALSQLYEL
jgi:hypothetical protein